MEKNRKIDEDLLSFIAESREIVEEIEPRLVKLGEELDNNRKPDDETVNLIFRGFHTIKGTAAFYQLDSIVSLAHKAETLLEFFRKNHETINASCTDVLCHTQIGRAHV
jgi:two-component system chemotaxis sensor kinase CheA